MMPLDTTSTVTLAVALLALVGTVVGGYFTFKGGKFAVTQSIQATTEGREAAWAAAYRSAAEPHLLYDVRRANDIMQLRTVVNNLELALQRVQTVFPPIEEPPPLFPKIEAP